MTKITCDKIRGMFLGIAIGDALFMPAETLSIEERNKKYGRITTYLKPVNHKWFKNRKTGMWTDDTQLTLVVAESLISCRKIDVDDMALRHIASWKNEGDFGFGGSTRDAIKKLGNGIHWSESGVTTKPGKGEGNGLPMKIAPVGAYNVSPLYYQQLYELALRDKIENTSEDTCDATGLSTLRHQHWNPVINLTNMTHNTPMARDSAIAHILAIGYCIATEPKNFSTDHFFSYIRTTMEDYNHTAKYLNDLLEKLLMLRHLPLDKMDVNDFIKIFNGGGCHVTDSLPFSYAFFLQNPVGIKAMLDVGNAGGDTDTNASIVGGMLGALNGASIFPQHLIDGLWQKERVLATAEKFYETFFTDKEEQCK